jgi:nucleoside-diphosphate-sugar epimerase
LIEMRVFLAGSTGAVGRQLMPMLSSAGHSVVGTTRSEAKAEAIRSAGAEPVLVADPFDRSAVAAAVREARPEVVVHQLSALAGVSSMRRFDHEFEPTNRLRTEGLDVLLDAAQEAGARRFVAQSFAGWPYARTGGPVKTEGDPLDPTPLAAMRETHAAIRHLESSVTTCGLDGLALRYGVFYGPGNAIGRGGAIVEQLERRRFPIVGDGAGVWSFAHIEDAASATVAAIERGARGVYNVVDDEPAPVCEWLPVLAEAVGAKPPRRVPVWLGRIAGGEPTVAMMTQVRGASNAKAKRELGWQPAWPSWRRGFREGLG